MERASHSIPTQPPGAPYLPGFGRCGIPQASPSSLSRIAQLRTAALVGLWAEIDGRSPATAFRSRPQGSCLYRSGNIPQSKIRHNLT
jgi:hypothetical protein